MSPFILILCLLFIYILDFVLGVQEIYFDYYRYMLALLVYSFILSYFIVVSLDFKTFISKVYFKFITSFIIISSLLTMILYVSIIERVNILISTATVIIIVYTIIYSTKSIIENYIQRLKDENTD